LICFGYSLHWFGEKRRIRREGLGITVSY
jgi:hypothetical protein